MTLYTKVRVSPALNTDKPKLREELDLLKSRLDELNRAKLDSTDNRARILYGTSWVQVFARKKDVEYFLSRTVSSARLSRENPRRDDGSGANPEGSTSQGSPGNLLQRPSSGFVSQSTPIQASGDNGGNDPAEQNMTADVEVALGIAYGVIDENNLQTPDLSVGRPSQTSLYALVSDASVLDSPATETLFSSSVSSVDSSVVGSDKENVAAEDEPRRRRGRPRRKTSKGKTASTSVADDSNEIVIIEKC